MCAAMADRAFFIRCVSMAAAALMISLSGAFSEAADLRNVQWGMSRLDVMAHEESAPVSFEAPFIYYRSRVSGQVHHLIYGFIEDKLVNAVYIVVTQRPDGYLRLKKRVEDKYGRPDKSYDGGSRNYRFFWDAAGTEITITPGNIRECRIEYAAKKFKSLRANKEKERKQLKLNELQWAY